MSYIVHKRIWRENDTSLQLNLGKNFYGSFSIFMPNFFFFVHWLQKYWPLETRKAKGTASPAAPSIKSIDAIASQCLVKSHSALLILLWFANGCLGKSANFTDKTNNTANATNRKLQKIICEENELICVKYYYVIGIVIAKWGYYIH